MTALILVDLQNDYFPGGRMELEGALPAAQKAAQALEAFRGRQWPVFHIRHLSLRPGSAFFLPGTPGAEIHLSVKPLPGEKVIEKHFPNSFRETSLLDELKAAGAEELVIAGNMTHMCIDATIRAAFDLGFKVTLLEDACATRELVWKGQTIPAASVQGAVFAALSRVYSQVLETGAYLESLPG